MKKTQKTYALGCLCLCAILLSCQSNSREVARITHSNPVIVTDNMESMMPGALFYTGKYLLWTDPFHSEYFIHVLDAETGKEINTLLKKGEGPQEFLTPNITLTDKDKLFVYDHNSEKAAVLSIEKAVNKENPFLKLEKKDLKNVTRFVETGNEERVFFLPSEKSPFTLEKNSNKIFFGKLPVDNDIENGYDVFQGIVNYHPAKKRIVYGTFRFPYIAIYKKCGETFCLERESLRNTDYSITDKKFTYHGEEKGLSEMALSKDYIVTIERDRTIDDTDESKVGRDFTKLPYTVFLYDYNLNLKKIINLGMPLLRLASDPSSNTLYAIGINPDFVLIKYEL